MFIVNITSVSAFAEEDIFCSTCNKYFSSSEFPNHYYDCSRCNTSTRHPHTCAFECEYCKELIEEGKESSHNCYVECDKCGNSYDRNNETHSCQECPICKKYFNSYQFPNHSCKCYICGDHNCLGHCSCGNKLPCSVPPHGECGTHPCSCLSPTTP